VSASEPPWSSSGRDRPAAGQPRRPGTSALPPARGPSTAVELASSAASEQHQQHTDHPNSTQLDPTQHNYNNNNNNNNNSNGLFRAAAYKK